MRPRFSLVLVVVVIALATVALASPQAPSPSQPHAPARSKFFSPAQWERQQQFEQTINAVPDAQRLRAWHDMLASEPHVAGTPGDQKVIDAIVKSFRDMGVDEVQVHEFWALLCDPIDAKLEIVSEGEVASGATSAPASAARNPSARRGVTVLPIAEDNLLNDPYIAHPGLSFGWNAYSGSGDVTAGVVYANYGTKEDFETLKRIGVDCTGKIVLARYGGNFRGYKARYAQDAGAIGLIIYTDPDDSGYRKGVTYPEGGWANDTCIQRGSIVALDAPGDPLTPGVPATEHAARIEIDRVDLPRIPVQPIGYRAAEAIMQRMTGRALPEDLVKTWQGGLPCAYRLEGGSGLQLRLMVKQERRIKKTANVIATITGDVDPRSTVYVGSHHDAWAFGAGDPTSGTILVMEAARSFADLARQGMRPRKSIAFCCWGAEEFGVIGSTEFCEQFGEDVRARAVAYINLDGATMGSSFGASSDPLLKAVIEEAASVVPQARATDGRSALDAWRGDKPAPSFGNLGGGSDHVGFYCHLGVPSCFLSSQGAPGTAYHSNYDNLAWYRQTVGDDYQPALMMTRIVNVLAARLANAVLSALDPSRYVADLREHVRTLEDRAAKRSVAFDAKPLVEAIDRLEPALDAAAKALNAALADDDADHAAARLTALAAMSERSWASFWQPRFPGGIDGRPWFRNYYASSDPDSGYASWMLPALRGPIETGDAAAVARATEEYVAILDQLRLLAASVEAVLNEQPDE